MASVNTTNSDRPTDKPACSTKGMKKEQLLDSTFTTASQALVMELVKSKSTWSLLMTVKIAV